MFNWEYQSKRDEEKRALAKKNDFTLLEINCDDTSFEKIKSNLLNSDLEEILSPFVDLYKIDWGKIGMQAESGSIKDICDEYNRGTSIVKLAEKYCLNRNTVGKYIKRGKELGIVF